MSQKLPVGEVMNEAVQFGLHRWATVLRLAWVPGLLSLALFGLFFVGIFDPAIFNANFETMSFEDIKGFLRVPMSTAIIGVVAVYLIAGLIFSGVAASLFRLVALGEERPGLFHLRLDGPAIRVFFSYVIVMIVTTAIWGAAFFGALAISGETLSGLGGSFQSFLELMAEIDRGGEPDISAYSDLMGAMGFFGLTFLLALIPLIYVTVKLVPFPAGSAAENRLLLFGSFGMTFGHAWSIFGVLVLYVLFLLVISMIYGLADEVFRMLAELLIQQGSVYAMVGLGIKLVAFAAAVFFQLFTMALQMAVPAIVYRRIKTGE